MSKKDYLKQDCKYKNNFSLNKYFNNFKGKKQIAVNSWEKDNKGFLISFLYLRMQTTKAKRNIIYDLLVKNLGFY